MALVATATLIQYGIPLISKVGEPSKEQEKVSQKVEQEENDKGSSTRKKEPSSQEKESDSSFGASWFAKTFYDGGFEEKMSKREAALVLGVRESAHPER
jgi:hypothetical protein